MQERAEKLDEALDPGADPNEAAEKSSFARYHFPKPSPLNMEFSGEQSWMGPGTTTALNPEIQIPIPRPALSPLFTLPQSSFGFGPGSNQQNNTSGPGLLSSSLAHSGAGSPFVSPMHFTNLASTRTLLRSMSNMFATPKDPKPE